VQSYKKEFIDFMLEAGVLKFGEFKTKSNRMAPYFINTGLYRSGEQIAKLGEFYAAAIKEMVKEGYDMLFGPAYKGIPLVVTTAIALYHQYGESMFYSFNRKEAKNHGEGGNLIGHFPQDGQKILIVEDVVTAGTSVRESIALLRSLADVNVVAQVISVDRMEKGQGELSAIRELEREFGIKTYPIVTIDEVVSYLSEEKKMIDKEMKKKIADYRDLYGV